MKILSKLKGLLRPKKKLTLCANDLISSMSTKLLIKLWNDRKFSTGEWSTFTDVMGKELTRRARKQWEGKIPPEILLLEQLRKNGFRDYTGWHDIVNNDGYTTYIVFGNYYRQTGKTIGISISKDCDKPFRAFLVQEGQNKLLKEKQTANVNTAIKVWKQYIKKYGIGPYLD